MNGLAFATNTVTVNGLATDRKGEAWHAQLGVANTNQPVWQAVAVVSGSTTNSGFALGQDFRRKSAPRLTISSPSFELCL